MSWVVGEHADGGQEVGDHGERCASGQLGRDHRERRGAVVERDHLARLDLRAHHVLGHQRLLAHLRLHAVGQIAVERPHRRARGPAADLPPRTQRDSSSSRSRCTVMMLTPYSSASWSTRTYPSSATRRRTASRRKSGDVCLREAPTLPRRVHARQPSTCDGRRADTGRTTSNGSPVPIAAVSSPVHRRPDGRCTRRRRGRPRRSQHAGPGRDPGRVRRLVGGRDVQGQVGGEHPVVQRCRHRTDHR